MKSITLTLGVLILFCSSSCSQDFKKLNYSEADSIKIQIAHKFATDFLTKLKDGSAYQFQDEAVETMKNQLSEDTQKVMYKQIKDQFGDFKSLVYAETWVSSSNSAMKIYRFKSDFEKSNKQLEIRVVLNEADKIAGFFIKPWSDMFK